ncbi:MAG TPA: efflux RND transporter periplasmic adaptor subunit [Phycisphaerae bacterium]|nr:efflux RND transporter periplasmic adaptor subunit [Phycisphaerae bacterium]
MKRLYVFAALALFIVIVSLMIYRSFDHHTGPAFRTVPVKRGDLQVTISATGTVEPEEVVDVGAQVAGKIQSFGKDPHDNSKFIDYGSAVEEGTILAQIDDSLYRADVESNLAQLEQAKANVLRSQADLESKIAAQAQADAGVDLAMVTVNHLNSIPEDSSATIEIQTADATLKQSKAALELAKANVGVAQATLAQARSSVAQDEANLVRARTNLDYCTIRSPVKGTIIDRRVNIGQTVVSSLNAPSLFLIAKDLRRIQVWASVNEADIGNIKAGQNARFTVDAYPGQTFTGQVGKIRLNAAMTQNVVTYTVEITTDNSSGKLLPYLTANVQFEVKNLKDVLMVPNVALRWIPLPATIAPESREAAPTSRPAGGQRGGKAAKAPREMVWVPSGPYVRSITVRAGSSDGTQTQIESDKIQEGTQVVVGEIAPGEEKESVTNPFAPQIFGGRR